MSFFFIEQINYFLKAVKVIAQLKLELRDFENDYSKIMEKKKNKKNVKTTKIIKKLNELINTLEIMENQYKMISSIMESSSDQIPAIRKKFEFLGKYFIDIHNQNEICFHILELSANFILNNTLNELSQICNLMRLKNKKKIAYLNELKIVVNCQNMIFSKYTIN